MKREKILCEFCGQFRKGMFCNLGDELRSRLNAEKTVQIYQRGQVLFYEGSPSFAIFCIHDGRVKLYKTEDGGAQHVIRLLGAGDILGYRAVLADEPYAAGAEAVEKTTACMIKRDTLDHLFRESSQLTLDMLSKLALELRVSEEQMLSILHHPVRRRAAELLLNLAELNDHGRQGRKESLGSLRRSDMAQMIGTAPETLSRTLREFDRQGLIKIDSRNIRIIDYSGLERVAGK